MKLKQQKNRLKQPWFYLIMIMFAFLPLCAVAATSDPSTGIVGSTLKYSGKILSEPGCTVDAPAPVNLGTWMTSASSGLGSGINTAGDLIRFSIIANCTAAGFQVALKIDAATVACEETLKCIELTAGGATGVGIQLAFFAPFYKGGAYGITFYDDYFLGGDGSSNYERLKEGENELKFGARYIQLDSTIGAGTANASATFNFRFTN